MADKPPSDKRNSKRARKVCLSANPPHPNPETGEGEGLTCHCCKVWFDHTVIPWRADHIVHWANGGRDTEDNLLPILTSCDAGVGGKAARDHKQIAKGKRVAAKHEGTYRPSKTPLKSNGQKIKSRGFDNQKANFPSGQKLQGRKFPTKAEREKINER